MEEYFTIGELAKKSEVSIQTIRYYEKRGLISVKARTSSQYRLFSVNTIQDIQLAKQHGCPNCQIIIHQVNTNSNSSTQLAKAYGIQSFPAVFLNGKVINHTKLTSR